MKPEQVLKLEARLAAIEYMIVHLIRTNYVAAEATPETVAQHHKELRPKLGDPAFSDLLAAAIEDALEALLQKVERACRAGQRPTA